MSVASFIERIYADAPAEIVAVFARYIDDVEASIARHAESQVETVAVVGNGMLEAGGKRLRPLLVFLSARAIGKPFDYERAVEIGAAMEMVHMATLIHDDVIDGAETRRGKPTASAVCGNTAAILSGDVLLAKAMRIMARDADRAVMETTSTAVMEMVEGEVRELETRGQFDLSESEHLGILEAKTAAFIRACCSVGAVLSGASQSEQELLEEYGRCIGLAFQIADDVLDFRGDNSKTGKPKATDFREGCATMPLICLRSRLNDEEEIFTRRKFGNGVTDDELEMLSSWMLARGAFDESLGLASEYAARARDAVASLSPTTDRDILAGVADYVTRRDS